MKLKYFLAREKLLPALKLFYPIRGGKNYFTPLNTMKLFCRSDHGTNGKFQLGGHRDVFVVP
jgi:hypothetical protein